MPTVEFLPARASLEAQPGSPLVAVARRAGIELELPCGGDGSCGRCVVRTSGGGVDTEERGRIPRAAVAAGYVLACQTRVGDQPVTVELPDTIKSEGQFADQGAHSLVDPQLLPTAHDIDPLVKKISLKVTPPELEDGLSDVDRVAASIRHKTTLDQVSFALSATRRAAAALRQDDGRVTVTVLPSPNVVQVLDIEARDTSSRHYGVAIDVGTTSIGVQLVSLTTGAVLSTQSDYNGQIPCGVDVISRINYAARTERLAELQSRVLDTMNHLISQAAFSCGVNPGEICQAALAGNTVMTHLLLGLPPEFLRLEPYTPTVLEPPTMAAGEIGLGICPAAHVELAPCVGSYVGGDITAGLLCTDLAVDTDHFNLFIDIGTNGEIVFGNRDFLMSCACSAGPAFEGGGIECGVRAAAGAIDRVGVDPASAQPTCSTIGDTAPNGICGSGLIDLLANLFKSGWIDRRGELERSRPSPYIDVTAKRARYSLVSAEDSGTGAAIWISETEIANVIRAKAAIFSASALLLERVGLTFDDLDSIYVAGSFGRFLDLEQAILIGMIPDLPHDKYSYLGNASLTGAYMTLVSRAHRRRQLETARRMTNIELSTDLEYMNHYTGALFLPHTDLALFPSASAALRSAEADHMKGRETDLD